MSRVRRSLAERAALIDQWRESGLSLPAFRAPRGVNPKTMSGWIHKTAYRVAIDQARGEAAAAAVRDQAGPTFLPVEVSGAGARRGTPGRAGLAILIGPGRRVVVAPGFDAETP